MDLRLNENKIKSIHFSSLSRFGNLTYLNLTKNEISYVEDGAFSAQFNLQVGPEHHSDSWGSGELRRKKCAIWYITLPHVTLPHLTLPNFPLPNINLPNRTWSKDT